MDPSSYRWVDQTSVSHDLRGAICGWEYQRRHEFARRSQIVRLGAQGQCFAELVQSNEIRILSGADASPPFLAS